MNDEPALGDDAEPGQNELTAENPRPERTRSSATTPWVVESDHFARAVEPGDRDLASDPATAGSGEAGDELGTDAAGDDHDDAVAQWRAKSEKRRRKAKRPFWVELPILIVVAFALTFLIQTFIAKVYYVPSGSMEQTINGVPSGGDRILASKIVYDFRDPHQGDIVVFKGPDSWADESNVSGPTSWIGKVGQSLGSVIGIAPANEKDFVKRVIAVGGQTVACCDANGAVTVDGRSLVEPYIYQPWSFTPGDPSNDCTPKVGDPTHYTSQRCFAPYKVPAGQLFVMGDHRSNSADSSYNCWQLTQVGEAAEMKQTGVDCNRPIPASDVIGRAVFIVMPPSRWRTLGNPDIDPGNSATGPTAALPVAGGVLLTLGLRGGLAMTPRRRRHRKSRRQVARDRRRGPDSR